MGGLNAGGGRNKRAAGPKGRGRPNHRGDRPIVSATEKAAREKEAARQALAKKLAEPLTAAVLATAREMRARFDAVLAKRAAKLKEEQTDGAA